MTFTAMATVSFTHFSCYCSMKTIKKEKNLLRVHSNIFTLMFKWQKVKLLLITVNIKLNPACYTQEFKAGEKCG